MGDKPENSDLVKHVLGKFNPEERKTIDETVKRACDAIETILTDGVEKAMSGYN